MSSSSQSETHRLRSYVALSRGTLSLGLGIGLVTSALSLIQPFWAGDLIERVQLSMPILPQLMVVISLSIAGAFLVGAQQLLLGAFAEKSTAHWRAWFLNGFFRLPLLGRQRRSSGWFSSRLVTDPPLIGRFVGTILVQAIQSGLMMVATLVALFSIDPISVLIPVGFALISLVIALMAARPAGRKRSAIQRQTSQMTEKMVTAVSAARLLIASNADQTQRRELDAAIEAARVQGTQLNLVYSLLGPVTMTLMQVAYASVFVVGGWRVASGELSFPELITFLMIFNLFQASLQEVSAFPSGLSECRAAMEHFVELDTIADGVAPNAVQVSERPAEDLAARVPDPPAPAVSFTDVYFAYPSESQPLLNGVTFEIPTGSLSVLVGSSGGGKSTCLGLVEGFFFASKGAVRVFGERLTSSSAFSVRDKIGYVDQDSTMLGGSVRDNLIFGSRTVPDDQVLVRSLQEVGLWAWLETRGGLDVEIGNAGLSISGGQRQRMSIARALLNDPQLLLLDEPTSSLDGFAESQIRSVLRELSTSRTVVLTAHRLSTILEADWIVVLQHGRVVGQGPHSELIETCEYYRALISAQTTRIDSVPATGELMTSAPVGDRSQGPLVGELK